MLLEPHESFEVCFVLFWRRDVYIERLLSLSPPLCRAGPSPRGKGLRRAVCWVPSACGSACLAEAGAVVLAGKPVILRSQCVPV